MRSKLGSITECFWRGLDGFNINFNSAYSVETVFDLLALPFKLSFISDGLVLATTANPEQFAPCLNTVSRRGKDVDAIRIRIVFMVSEDPGVDSFPRKSEGNLNDPAVISGNSVTKVGYIFNH